MSLMGFQGCYFSSFRKHKAGRAVQRWHHELTKPLLSSQAFSRSNHEVFLEHKLKGLENEKREKERKKMQNIKLKKIK